LARTGQEVMAIDLVIFTDIGKAGKRPFSSAAPISSNCFSNP
jgi:hypothetical protein